MKYFYIHGWGATGETTAKLLKEAINEEITILKWNCTKTFGENLENMLKFLESESEDFLLMGSSMGGFYANTLANKLDVPCALFNPVIEPKEVLKKFQKDAPAIITDELINSYENGKDKILPRVIVAGLNDEVLNPNKTIEYWKGKCNLITTQDGHEIKDFKPFKDELLHLANTILFYDEGEIM